MRSALALLFVVVCPLLLECSPTCQAGNQSDLVEGLCPVKLSPAGGRLPSECVTVRVWMSADDLKKEPQVHILSPVQKSFSPVRKRKSQSKQSKTDPANRERVRCSSPNKHVALWEFVYDCVPATAASVSVSYSSASRRCTVPDPKPQFDVCVNASSKSLTVTVKPGRKVFVRLCYLEAAAHCEGLPALPAVMTDPSTSPPVHFVVPYLLPCLCVEVYYTDIDAGRNRTCPIPVELADATDVLRSSEVKLYESSLRWASVCGLRKLPQRISASLCWKLTQHVCTPVPNSTLHHSQDGNILIYNTSAVDRHPRMCVLVSLRGSQNPFCEFQSDMTSWEVSVGLGRQSLTVHVASKEPASFSAQLCVLEETGCAASGPVHVLTEDAQIEVPPRLAGPPCVQVWQSHPALNGRRILCPDYTHHRWGLCAAAAAIFVLVLVLLGIFIQRLVRTGAAGWLYIHTPVLLVCSSEHPAHVSAACALASILQGELGANVHMALWAQTSQREAGAGVADLGPIPWLYGQWEAVRRAQGKVLMIWSPEAKEVYGAAGVEEGESKKKDASGAQRRHEGIKAEVEADCELSEKLFKCKKEEATGRKNWEAHQSSTVTGPVFAAALSCLQGALQQSKALGAAIVYFQGLGHSRDIPRALRGVPRYCLPQDFRGLIQELEGARGSFPWHCWPRLLSKVLSMWLAQKLASRLQTLLPGSRLTGAEPAPEREPRAERLQGAHGRSSQVS